MERKIYTKTAIGVCVPIMCKKIKSASLPIICCMMCEEAARKKITRKIEKKKAFG